MQLLYNTATSTAAIQESIACLHGDAESIEGIGAVGAPLQGVFFCLRLFLAALVLLVGAIHGHGRVDGVQQVRVILLVDQDAVGALAEEHAVDELLLDRVLPWQTDIKLTHYPAMTDEPLCDDGMEVCL